MAVVIGTLTAGTMDVTYSDALTHTLAYDRNHGNIVHGVITKVPGAGDIDGGRNWLTRQFLDKYPKADWLLMIDSDMGWAPDAIHRLLAAADPDKSPIVGGLAFGSRPSGQHSWGVATFDMFPTIYQNRDGVLKQVHDYPDNTLVTVDATGAAFLLIHRTVFEKLSDFEDHWWDRVVWNERRYGEDLSFCLKASSVDLPVKVHTGVDITHTKTIALDSYLYRHRPTPPNVVIIPVKDRLDLTRNLVGQLEGQPVDRLLLYDNGSTDGTQEWADAHPLAERVPAAGWTLHTMWNDGIAKAMQYSTRSNVFILNNDLDLDDRFVVEMAAGLRDSDHVAVSPNYDQRPRTSRFQTLHGICAGRYDGTGGLAGFAFAVRGEWFANGWRFPEECAWYFGDTDLALSIEKAGHTHGMVLDAACVHVDGGSQTGDWESPEWRQKLARDEQAFLKRWPDIQLQTA